MYYRVLVASQRFHGQESLTYLADEALQVGQIVRVPLQRQLVTGMVEAPTTKPTFTVKSVSQVTPLVAPREVLQLATWLTKYYPAPLGMITELFSPPALPKTVILPSQTTSTAAPALAKLPPLTPEQATTLQAINTNPGHSFLLHGDTGTGKTRIYLELALQAVKAGESALVLTPEIGLTEPLLQTFAKVFGDRVLVTHSELTPAERRDVWIKVATATEPIILIGPRSALFYPLHTLGLIVMDESHDGAYKQEQAPYYQTSRVAAQLAHLHKARLIMGSATPPLSDYYWFEQKGLPILRMTTPATGQLLPSVVTLLDYRDKGLFNRSPWLADALVEAIDIATNNGEQSLLFLNRRGSARLVLCQNCGWQAMCPNCDVPLTYHQDQHLMRCHSCDFSDHIPSQCPECGAAELIFQGIGTKALEAEIQRLFPQAKVSRFDRDTHRLERLRHQYTELQAGKVDVLIGTQTIAKGFDLPKLSVVGIVQADSGLQMPDYNANERTFQLISQVSGRIGRGHRQGALFVQTYEPTSPLLQFALTKDYASFYQQELQEREHYKFPPFYFLLKVTCARASSKAAASACTKVATTLQAAKLPVIIEGPTPRFIEKLAGKYAWHLVIKARHRQALLDCVKLLPGNCTYDLDPSDLL